MIDGNKQDYSDSHAHMVHLFNKFVELGFLVSGKSTVWEDTDDCEKQYISTLGIYLMALLSSFFGITTDLEIGYPGHVKNVMGVLNSTKKLYLK